MPSVKVVPPNYFKDISRKFYISQCDGTNLNTSKASIISCNTMLRDSPKKAYLKMNLKTFRRIINRTKKNLKVDKNKTLKYIIDLLQKKQLINTRVFIELSKNLEVVEGFNKIYKKYDKNHKKPFKKYPLDARKFALTLQFYSPSAYKYVRNTFHTFLPHAQILYKWYENANGEPGFCTETMNRLREKAKSSEKHIYCALIVDEMPIKKTRIWTGKHFEGLIDMGMGRGDNSEVATQVYVFVLVAIDESWKLPLAYFFVDNLEADMKANLIKLALKKCAKVGVQIRAVTFDGCQSNIETMKKLGCELDDLKKLKTCFKHPLTDYNVVVFLDVCHMLKLIKETFESIPVIYNSEDKSIKWKFVSDLHNLQGENCLHLDNKLHRHVYFKNQIMNAKLSPQVLSRSVAEAIDFCSNILNIPTFQGSESTVEFIKILNDISDIFSTRSIKDVGFETFLSKSNSEKILQFLPKMTDYLLSLSINIKIKRTFTFETKTKTRCFMKKVPLVASNTLQSDVGVLGLLVSIRSLITVYENLIATNILPFIIIPSFSQDHIHQFFYDIRNENHINPNTIEFKDSFKKLITELDAKLQGNFLPSKYTPILSASSSLNKINNSSAGFRYNETEEINLNTVKILETLQLNFNKYQAKCNELCERLDKSQTTDNISQVVGYVTGFVLSSLITNLNCEDCKILLLEEDKLLFHRLIDLKDMGGLCYPEEDVFDICMTAERIIRKQIRIDDGRIRLENYNKGLLILTVFNSYARNNVFLRGNHSHKLDLIILITDKYADVRLNYIFKEK